MKRPAGRWLRTRNIVVAGGLAVSVVLGSPSPAGSLDVETKANVVTTPLFSARRVPTLVQSVAATPTLLPELQGVMDDSPPDTCLVVAVAGRTLFGAHGSAALIPASNQKVVTAQLALDVLGADHRFRTDVGGELGPDGTVDGDLYLVGGGDPVLRTKAYADYLGDAAGKGTSLEALADAVVAKGVRHVTGSVVGDESRYDAQRLVPGWPERYLDQHQLGPLSALEVNQSFTSFPEVYSEEHLDQLVDTDDPPRFAAETFTDLLEARGVTIDASAHAGVRPEGTVSLAHVTSPPLTEIVAQLLNRSDNQIAELLVKEAGVTHGAGGSTAAGLEVFADAFSDLGLSALGVQMHDGSGLGYDNRLTCALLAALLERAGADSSIADGLAVGGESGTLRERFEDPATKGRIRAKTGSLNDVSSLSGFADPTDTPPVVFSYIANGAPVTPDLLEIQERLGRALVGYAQTYPADALGPR